MSSLEAYLLEIHDVVVDYDDTGFDEYWSEDRTITINSTSSLEHQLYVLLHEAGHVLLRDKEDFKLMCPDVATNRIETLKEEVLAWEEARKLAQTLGIPLGDPWITNYRNALWRYTQWVVNNAEDN